METCSDNSLTSVGLGVRLAKNALGGADAWATLQQYTAARIALGRSGGSLRTPSVLDFRLAHAAARDAVHAAFHAEQVQRQLASVQVDAVQVQTRTTDKLAYLKNPELGRRLADASAEALRRYAKVWGSRDLVIVVSDGLSALAAQRHAAESITLLMHELVPDWSIYPIVIAPFGRVKISDEIGDLLRARHALIFIGERPGLGAPDSLSAYFTYHPQLDRVDSDRNCISNIRPEGMPLAVAAKKIARLLRESERLKISGTALKDRVTGNELVE